jgi:glutaminase
MSDIDFQTVLEEICDEVQPLIGQGEVASYIPELACIPSEKFGMALLTCDGQMFSVGDAAERFSIQSISKVLSLALAIQQVGPSLWNRVGREPSGSAFNSLVQLESEEGIPRNPFINAGALVVTDVILTELAEATQTVLNFARRASGVNDIAFDDAVAASEAESGYRNVALANFIRAFNNLDNEPADVLAAYFKHCSIAMSCEDLTKAFMFLARSGVGFTGERLLSAERTKYINALMLT